MFWFFLILAILCVIFKWQLIGTLLILFILGCVLYDEITGIGKGKQND